MLDSSPNIPGGDGKICLIAFQKNELATLTAWIGIINLN